MKGSKQEKKLAKRIEGWERSTKTGGRDAIKYAFHKPGSNKK